VFGHHHATITTWLRRAGMHSATLHERFCQNLTLAHLQLDELRTRLRSRVRALWLWVVVEELTKIMPVLHHPEGTRRADAGCGPSGSPRAAWAAGSCLPVFTSDGLNLYFYALTAHFGQWVEVLGRRKRQWQVATGLIYGQVKKREKAPAAGGGYVSATLWDVRSIEGRTHAARAKWAAQYRICRAREFDAAADGGGAEAPDLVDDAGGAAASTPSGVVAGLLSLRAAA
jgi:hypothetical protein